jgi:hypothetical protein
VCTYPLCNYALEHDVLVTETYSLVYIRNSNKNKIILLCIPHMNHLKWLPLILTNFCFSCWDIDTATGLHFRISHPLSTSGNFKISRTVPKLDHILIYREILVFLVLIISTLQIFHVFLTDMVYATYEF